MSFKKTLLKKSLDLGADIVKVASINDFDDAPQGHHPTDVLEDTHSIIVLGMKYLYTQVQSIPLEREEESSFFADSPRQDMFAGHNSLQS